MPDRNANASRARVAEEIRRGVAGFIEGPGCLRSDILAAQTARACPACGITLGEIADEVVAAAVSARMPVELGRTRPALRLGRISRGASVAAAAGRHQSSLGSGHLLPGRFL